MSCDPGRRSAEHTQARPPGDRFAQLSQPGAHDSYGDASIAPTAGTGRLVCHELDRRLYRDRRERNGDVGITRYHRRGNPCARPPLPGESESGVRSAVRSDRGDRHVAEQS